MCTNDFLAEWFSPDIALPFGRVRQHQMIRTQPRIDVAERDGALILTAELAGVRREDVRVDLDNGTLVIRGESHVDGPSADEEYVHVERSIGTCYRRLPLPFHPDAAKITATLIDGVLEVSIPESPQAPTVTETITVN